MPAVNDLLLGFLLYKSRLVPRVLPLMGLIGAPLLVANTIATMFGITGPIFVLTAIGVIPIALFEFSLGVWLTVKGFNPSAITCRVWKNGNKRAFEARHRYIHIRRDSKMKAIVYTKYGSPDVLQLKEVEKPTPKDNEVLVKVQATSINAADWHLLTADIFLVRLNAGLLKPKHTILGCDIAGQVEAVGRDVQRFKPGDLVFGDVFWHNYGGFAEYVTASESDLALKPANLSFDEAAAVPLAAKTALQGLRDLGQIQAGQKVLINGASGGVGTFAVQIAKYFGAEVTAVCSTRNVDMARALGRNPRH